MMEKFLQKHLKNTKSTNLFQTQAKPKKKPAGFVNIYQIVALRVRKYVPFDNALGR